MVRSKQTLTPIKKTNYVIFHSKVRKIDEFISIKIGSKTIKGENYVKYLGIFISHGISVWGLIQQFLSLFVRYKRKLSELLL